MNFYALYLSSHIPLFHSLLIYRFIKRYIEPTDPLLLFGCYNIPTLLL